MKAYLDELIATERHFKTKQDQDKQALIEIRARAKEFKLQQQQEKNEAKEKEKAKGTTREVEIPPQDKDKWRGRRRGKTSSATSRGERRLDGGENGNPVAIVRGGIAGEQQQQQQQQQQQEQERRVKMKDGNERTNNWLSSLAMPGLTKGLGSLDMRQAQLNMEKVAGRIPSTAQQFLADVPAAVVGAAGTAFQSKSAGYGGLRRVPLAIIP
ncbi:MAG: intercellular trafficking and secretion [Watsoniomyces obsoletus]|nr:MAG: intercellular trafficking and secretion [Watsoniomyces obsoletus]